MWPIAPELDPFPIAVRMHQEGDIERAVSLYSEILDRRPDHAGAWHLLGVASQQRGDPARAVERIGKAVALDGSKAVYHNNLGVALRETGQLDRAIESFRRALLIRADYADAHSNLGMALHELGRYPEALDALEAALRLQPRHADALFHLANLRRDLGRGAEAIEAYRAALLARPDRAAAHNNLGAVLLAAGRAGEAAESFRRALALEPGNAEARHNSGAALAELDRVEEAAEAYEAAARLRPDRPGWSLRTAGLCPVVFPDVDSIRRYRAGLGARLDALLASPPPLDACDLAREGTIPSFHLSHHGRGNRGLKEKFAALYEPHFPRPRPAAAPSGRARIGFLVTKAHEGGFLRSDAGLIRHLDRERFEPVVLCSEAAAAACRRALRDVDVTCLAFPDQLEEAARRVADARCDLLYHWQIGTDPLNYFLPFARLAPAQCTGWGTHGTTGIAAVDDYLSSDLVEADGAEAHYTERLVRFETFPTFQPRIPRPRGARRCEFGLPDPGHLYLCPPRLAKFHPDVDPLLRGVLEADPRGYVVILEGSARHGYERLRARFARTLGRAADRVVFVPAQPPEAFYRLLSLADVLLDTPHYSIGLMGYDAFGLGLPVVTLPGELNLGRYGLGFYRRMGLEGLVAQSADDYVARAVRLGTDPGYREAVRAEIDARSPILFNDLQSVRAHETYFDQAIRRARYDGG